MYVQAQHEMLVQMSQPTLHYFPFKTYISVVQTFLNSLTNCNLLHDVNTLLCSFSTIVLFTIVMIHNCTVACFHMIFLLIVQC